MASNEEPYVKKINSKYLISGYSRENSKPATYISTSIIDIIFLYFPKINGYKFIWKISPSNNISTLKSLDSDAFDIGLSNKFFLKLQTISNLKTQNNSNTTNRRNAPSGFNWGNNNNNNNTTNNTLFNNANTNNTNTNDDIDHSLKDDLFALSLMSFPLPSKYNYAIIHFEMYCYEINEEYSAIWVLNNQRNYTQSGESVPPFNMNNMNNNNPDNDTLNLIQTSWNIFSNDTLMHFLSRSGVTFECTLNVLKLIPRNDNNSWGWGGGNYNRRRNRRSPNNYVDDMKPYSYECIEYQNQNKMRFSWNISNPGMIRKLINETFNVKADIMYHSDVNYDMLQLKVCGKPKEKKVCFRIQLCGLPKDTTRMGVKLELFSTDYDGKKIKIMSEIVTFSYNKAIYNLSKDKNDIIYELIVHNKKLVIFCKANIIQKYDNMGDLVMTKKIFFDAESKHSDDQKSDESETEQKRSLNIHVNTKEFNESNAKVFKSKKDFFIWHITDKNLLNRIKNISIDEHFTSDVFELFGYKWYVSIHAGDTVSGQANWNAGWGGNNLRNSTQNINPDIIAIFVNSLCTQSIQIDCKISVQILQKSKKHSYFQRYVGGEIQRRNNPYQKDFLQYGLSKLMSLSQITIKVEIDMIYEGLRNHAFGFGNESVRKEKEENDKSMVLDKEVKKWLCDVVGLEEYCNTFKVHDISDMDIIRSIKIDDIKAMGIKKVGHQIKLLNKIKLL